MRNPIELNVWPEGSSQFHKALIDILNNWYQRFNSNPELLPLEAYTVADLPTPTDDGYYMAYCTDETGGAIPVFWDGTNWRRVTDRAIAS